ncbi:MAG TPA: orotidine-5'-phosphate decarboxylase [Candidatus Paceibacterota bacterium]|nr:orotidine-5'-phosphate decarboxylase [Candidatus Paceibacterota bacterium]
MAEARSRIIFAHDKDIFTKEDQARYKSFRRHIGWIKVGLQAMTHEDRNGVSAATRLRKWALAQGFDVMWDMKLDDIPNTTGNAVRNIAAHGSSLITLHASAGKPAMAAAAEALAQSGKRAALLAVTVLTSINKKECVSIFGDSPGPKVVQFARDAIAMGVTGLVCSPQELRALEQADLSHELMLVVPGVRPAWASAHDQKRIMTPAQAIRAGADLLVIGRPISEHRNPQEAARLIWEEIESV